MDHATIGNAPSSPPLTWFSYTVSPRPAGDAAAQQLCILTKEQLCILTKEFAHRHVALCLPIAMSRSHVIQTSSVDETRKASRPPSRKHASGGRLQARILPRVSKNKESDCGRDPQDANEHRRPPFPQVDTIPLRSQHMVPGKRSQSSYQGQSKVTRCIQEADCTRSLPVFQAYQRRTRLSLSVFVLPSQQVRQSCQSYSKGVLPSQHPFLPRSTPRRAIV